MANKDGGNMGRPSKYDPKYCDKIIKWAGEDSLPKQWAPRIGVARSTLGQWVLDYPQFSVAWEQAKDICEGAWLQKAIDAQDNVQLAKVKYLLSIAFQVSEVHKVEAKQEVDATIQTTVEVSFGDRPE